MLALRTICHKNDLRVTDEQLNRLSAYVNMLLDWNRRINLVSRQDVANVWTSHILHSISILFQFSFADETRIVDLGTGGGLPGIPLAILLPKSDFLLVDATQKKIKAVDEMIRGLGLPNASAEWGRGDELSRQPRLTGSFDIVISRAMGSLKELVQHGKEFLRRGAEKPGILVNADVTFAPQRSIDRRCLIAYKGGDVGREISAAARNSEVEKIEEVPLMFKGSSEVGIFDKKIILVQLKRK